MCVYITILILNYINIYYNFYLLCHNIYYIFNTNNLFIYQYLNNPNTNKMSNQFESGCAHCFKHSVILYNCNICNKISYCSQKCQTADYEKHNNECKLIKQEHGYAAHTPAANPVLRWKELYPNEWLHMTLAIKILVKLKLSLPWVFIREFEEEEENTTKPSTNFDLINTDDFYTNVLDKLEVNFRNSCKEIYKNRREGAFSVFIISLHPHYPIYHCMLKI